MRLRSTGEALLAIACWRHRPRRQDRQRKDDQALPVSPGGYSSCAPAARGNVRSLRSLTVVSLRVGDPRLDAYLSERYGDDGRCSQSLRCATTTPPRCISSRPPPCADYRLRLLSR
jgi:hypothetical protein